MSGIGPGKTGHVPDINFSCPEYDQCFLAMFRTSLYDVRNKASFQKFVEVDVRNMASDVRNMASDVRNTASDVRNRARDVRNRTKNPGHVSDIKDRCPEYGQLKLAMFRTSNIYVRNRTRRN